MLIWGIFSRALGFVLAVNFLSVLPQIRGLVGPEGLEPANLLFAAVKRDLGPLVRFLRFPSLFLFNSSNGFLSFVCLMGLAASVGIIVGAGEATSWLFLIAWVCWLSIQVSNPTLFSFPWDLLLSECAFFGAFLPPLARLPEFGALALPSAAIVFYFNWLLFRVIFGMGLTRFKKRGETEKDLTYIYHFLQWQPMPTPVAYYLRALPRWVHKACFFFLFWAEVMAAFALFGSPHLRWVALVSIAALQLGIWAAGNYGAFNLLGLILCIPLALPLPGLHEWTAGWAGAALVFYCALSLPSVLLANFWTGTLWLYQLKSIQESKFRWLLGPIAAVLRFFAPFRLLNSYGVFRHQEIYLRDRLIMRIQGSLDGKDWKDYETKFLSSRPDKRPPFFAPHHPRLDHYLFYGLCEPHSLKFFMIMACNPYYFHPFCLTEKLVQKLLRNDPVALSFFAANPFPEVSPRYVRYALYKYEFTTPREKSETGAWWKTACLGASDPIQKIPVEEGAGIQAVYDRFVSQTQSRGMFSVREFVDCVSGKKVSMHLHTIRRFT